MPYSYSDQEARKEITAILGLRTPKVVIILPSKSNIMYGVISRSELHETLCHLWNKYKINTKNFQEQLSTVRSQVIVEEYNLSSF